MWLTHIMPDLRLGFVNVRGSAVGMVEVLERVMEEKELDVLVVTETWMKVPSSMRTALQFHSVEAEVDPKKSGRHWAGVAVLYGLRSPFPCRLVAEDQKDG